MVLLQRDFDLSSSRIGQGTVSATAFLGVRSSADLSHRQRESLRSNPPNDSPTAFCEDAFSRIFSEPRSARAYSQDKADFRGPSVAGSCVVPSNSGNGPDRGSFGPNL